MKESISTNMGSISREELISWLYQLIEHELDKPDNETDKDLIAECSDYLEELQADDQTISDAEILLRLEQIKKRVSLEKARDIPSGTPVKKKTPRLFFKVFIPIAATFLALILTLSVAAAVNGTSIGKFISDNLQIILGIPKGETIDKGNITVIKASGKASYSSIEEFLNEENLNILFPQPLPEDVMLDHIRLYILEDNQITVTFVFKNERLQLAVKNAYSADYAKENYLEKWDGGKTTFYLYALDSQYLASGQFDGYEYTLRSSDPELLKQITKNMKEIEK